MRVPATLLLILALAGCVAPSAPPSGDEAGARAGADAPQRFVWEMSGCREIIATFEVDTAALAALLPEGFAPEAGRVPGRSPAGIDVFACESSTETEGERAPASYASFWTSVTAPEELMGNATSAFVKWDTLVQDPIARGVLQAAGASVRGGSATIGALTPLGGTVGEVSYDDAGTITVTTPPSAPQPGGGAGEGVLREWAVADDGRLVAMWEVDLGQTGGERTAGTIDVPPDSMAARLYGAARIPSVVTLGDAELRDGWMQVVG